MSTVDRTKSEIIHRFQDPIHFCRLFWPQFELYDKQQEIMYSVRDNYETIVPAGNELGKDFIAALTVLWFFCSRRPCKVVTTSASGSQLENVLWGEIRRFLDQARMKLPIEYTHLHLYQRWPEDGKRYPNSEVVGKVVQKGESMLGMHVARADRIYPTTLLVVDEASGVDDDTYERADTWTHRKLVIGNPYPCTNFFFRGTKEGNKEAVITTGEYKDYRNVIRVKATDSPNIKLAMLQKRKGKKITNEELVPGLARYSDYLQRRETWDQVRQCIGLDAEFYEGAEVLLFPPAWLNKAEDLAIKKAGIRRTAEGIGVDPAEGGDSTCFAAVDSYGLIELISKKTPDTSVVTGELLAFMRKHGLIPDSPMSCNKVCFDRGGGGKQHADRLREQGYPVRTVGFGEAATQPTHAGIKPIEERKEEQEQRYVYKNKRAEMYGRLSLRLDPSIPNTQFAIPSDCQELRRQLAVIPRLYDNEGRLILPPKQSVSLQKNRREANIITLVDLIGHSPDEADATVLAVYAMEVEGEPLLGPII